MPTKLNITPGEWRLCETSKTTGAQKVIRNSKDRGDWQIAFVASDAWELQLDDQQESEANATAIITAVNNTYHKGINPEAVPEMFEVLNEISEQCLSGLPVNYSKLLSVIQKATL